MTLLAPNWVQISLYGNKLWQVERDSSPPKRASVLHCFGKRFFYTLKHKFL